MAKKIVYLGAFLTERSKEALLKDFPPIHKNVFADHVTLVFNPSVDDQLAFINNCLNYGMDRAVRVLREVRDEKGQAVVVELAHAGFHTQAALHITISCADGVKPVYSNELIAGDKSKDIDPVASSTYFVRMDTYPRSL